MPYPLARISQDAGLPWPRPRASEQRAFDFEAADPRAIVTAPEPRRGVYLSHQSDEVHPLVDAVAMLVVISRALDRFSLAVAKRVQFYEPGGRRAR